MGSRFDPRTAGGVPLVRCRHFVESDSDARGPNLFRHRLESIETVALDGSELWSMDAGAVIQSTPSAWRMERSLPRLWRAGCSQ